ncbi:bifunctional UDP-N-acetylglucosamine diphosphorylase/glucosamine-1-phosphate N-acetyltransferase GlmU [Vineibacter terrae]|uniref:Bifunctional protein GlmU n=1 Tax=Vineibacter terrae TaxID=2586908 RepID=A0A5C8PIN1_9HYPH|nr:bifunctional UDP-N-acetylglucosamine diphosphorylase/glucosamine-1-phosphate N-acetyltransferase GlmU [Vineibacter terrae]TXL73679.1 bifunctional UDP-N-acetylglucosamine diphosphorylase/glucosamine-1-phosphate N-acetyltransferase GlmU [Vineibacter terrae]
MTRPLAVVVLAAGAGTRMKSTLPKVLHPVAGCPMLRHVLAAAEALRPDRIIVVGPPGRDDVAQAAAPHRCVIQDRPLGTGHAVKAALPALKGFGGDVLVAFGDSPLLTTATLRRLLAARRKAPGRPKRRIALGVLGFRAADPTPYGRLVRNAAGDLERIVEGRDASAEERRIDVVNSGVMAIDGTLLAGLLRGLRNDNAKGEYYLTDLVGLARRAGHRCVVVEGSEAEFRGVNSKADLAEAEAAMQARLRRAALDGGVTMIDPASVWLAADTRFGRDVTIGPNTLFGPGVTVGDGVTIHGFCHIEEAVIGARSTVGPFARVRGGTRIGREVHVGNFIELKNTALGDGAKANHVSYLGDGTVGERVNIGAGTIFVNYDGYGKWRTVVGDDAFIGSNSSLVAPVRVGRGANVTAGSVVTADVAADAVSFGRARQVDKPAAARPLRAKMKARAATAKAEGWKMQATAPRR